MNEKLKMAVWALDTVCYASADRRRQILIDRVVNWNLSPDGWVAAALGCVDDKDIPDVALEFFLADVKAGYYDLHDIEPVASP